METAESNESPLEEATNDHWGEEILSLPIAKLNVSDAGRRRLKQGVGIGGACLVLTGNKAVGVRHYRSKGKRR